MKRCQMPYGLDGGPCNGKIVPARRVRPLAVGDPPQFPPGFETISAHCEECGERPR